MAVARRSLHVRAILSSHEQPVRGHTEQQGIEMALRQIGCRLEGSSVAGGRRSQLGQNFGARSRSIEKQEQAPRALVFEAHDEMPQARDGGTAASLCASERARARTIARASRESWGERTEVENLE